MTKTIEKKALIIASSTEVAHSVFPAISNKAEHHLIVAGNFGAAAMQPYDNVIRNILLAIYTEEVEEVYIIGEQNKVNSADLLAKLYQAGVSEKTIQTLEYIGAVGSSLSTWLAGEADVKQTILNNIQLLKSHPLVPNQIRIYGIIASSETGEFETIDFETVA